MTRDEKIEALIWLDSTAENGSDTVLTILRHGFKGYDNMTDEEIDKEYADAFGEDDE